VMQVAENGKTTQSYSYDISGQLATADYGDSKETFLWDGLALLSRNNLKYVNEPAVTGGNPILAGNKMLFDDMLGNTLGVKDGEKFSAIDRDAFGELKPGEKPNLAVNFFTGKPEVDGLGYSFLFRNYRADLGKWQTTDPLGYPDGWNNLAYVNNMVFTIDPLGLCKYMDVSGAVYDYDFKNPPPKEEVYKMISCGYTTKYNNEFKSGSLTSKSFTIGCKTSEELPLVSAPNFSFIYTYKHDCKDSTKQNHDGSITIQVLFDTYSTQTQKIYECGRVEGIGKASLSRVQVGGITVVESKACSE
ncbi:RHS repeat domain-containing protein, partial [Victivallis vadensis]|uniref:RHS repeat domain-containing protein n=1 Tax=Victivallis vadensis TaxID=172901 RepID=UPI003D03BCF7